MAAVSASYLTVFEIVKIRLSAQDSKDEKVSSEKSFCWKCSCKAPWKTTKFRGIKLITMYFLDISVFVWEWLTQIFSKALGREPVSPCYPTCRGKPVPTNHAQRPELCHSFVSAIASDSPELKAPGTMVRASRSCICLSSYVLKSSADFHTVNLTVSQHGSTG